MFKNLITTKEGFLELQEYAGGQPSVRASNKVIPYLDDHCREFIGKSPFVTISTSGANGQCDVSPRGDAPGFVLVLDDHHLFIPERPGNRRMDSVQNILENPNVGSLFMIPGLGETLRVNGKAYISRDSDLLERCAANGKLPLFGIGVEVEQCFAHCAKAFIRSGLWKPQSWLEKEALPFMAQVFHDHCKLPNCTVEEMEEALNEGYKTRLY